jgi:hypothetical protein
MQSSELQRVASLVLNLNAVFFHAWSQQGNDCKPGRADVLWYLSCGVSEMERFLKSFWLNAMMLLRAALRGHRKFLEEEANLALNLMFLEFLFTAMASSLG